MSAEKSLVSQPDYGSEIITICEKNRVNFKKIIYSGCNPMPLGSSFYDDTIEEVWDDLLKKHKAS